VSDWQAGAPNSLIPPIALNPRIEKEAVWESVFMKPAPVNSVACNQGTEKTKGQSIWRLQLISGQKWFAQ
jgi:hypothetical protein